MTGADWSYLAVFLVGSAALYVKGNAAVYHPKTMIDVGGKRISTRQYLLRRKLRSPLVRRLFELLVIRPLAIIWVRYQIWRDPDGV